MKKETINKLKNYVEKAKYAIYTEEECDKDCVKFSALIFHIENIVNIISQSEE